MLKVEKKKEVESSSKMEVSRLPTDSTSHDEVRRVFQVLKLKLLRYIVSANFSQNRQRTLDLSIIMTLLEMQPSLYKKAKKAFHQFQIIMFASASEQS